MPQFPAWTDPLAAWTTAVQSRSDQLRDAVSDFVTRTVEASIAVPATGAELVARTRSYCEQLPNAMVDELRRRVNVLDLATKHDVRAQSRLGRSRVSFVLKEFLEEQRSHDEALISAIRTEIQEELQRFAIAVSDDLFAIDEQPSPNGDGAGRAAPAGGPEAEDDEDDELDLVGYYGIRPADDDGDYLDDDEVMVRRGAPGLTDE